jgi:hypothetical protein
MSRFIPIILFIVLTSGGGCQATLPERAFQMSDSALQVRRLQTRRFDDIDEEKLLAASAGVLQDLGFNLDESETELGLVVASKRRTVEPSVKGTIVLLLDIFADIEISVDKEQRIRASLVSWPDPKRDRSYFVRVTFQRIVWNTEDEISRQEALNDARLYQRFFEQLSKSVFLEAHSI